MEIQRVIIKLVYEFWIDTTITQKLQTNPQFYIPITAFNSDLYINTLLERGLLNTVIPDLLYNYTTIRMTENLYENKKMSQDYNLKRNKN